LPPLRATVLSRSSCG